jgi:hypothetical protein
MLFLIVLTAVAVVVAVGALQNGQAVTVSSSSGIFSPRSPSSSLLPRRAVSLSACWDAAGLD